MGFLCFCWFLAFLNVHLLGSCLLLFLDAYLFPNERQIKAIDFCGWEGSGIREEMREGRKL